MDTFDPAAPPPASWPLVCELTAFGGLFHEMVRRMEAFEASGRSSPDADTIPNTIVSLLTQVLEPYAAARADDVQVTAGVLEDVLAVLGEELFFVDPDALSPAPPRRRGAGGGHRPVRRRRP